MPHVSSSDNADVFYIVDGHGLAPFPKGNSEDRMKESLEQFSSEFGGVSSEIFLLRTLDSELFPSVTALSR
jgi:hypothetical protein